ncbi:hypothetical protein DV454_001724 [Geotrichum candidum]|nr:hypothetical protein DV454_001724 [Geotrichum candidum]
MPVTPKPSAAPVKTFEDITAEKIQGTNDSSITSKRSVERLYWSKQSPGSKPSRAARHVEFFRPFVEKPQRRSPVINRGYWTRMEAITRHIEDIIESSNCSKNVIINLGCGFDPYPFQYLSNHGSSSNTVFVDIDYPDLIRRKVRMLQKTKDILDIIGEQTTIDVDLKRSKNNEGVMLATPSYLAIGCDLTLLDELSDLLRTIFVESDTLYAFTAEVSITYMPKDAADNLIAWASQFQHSRFVLLEQIIPSGPDQPFAQTMLKHFNKLNTPLNSVTTYQKVSDQKERFASRGWNHVQASDLYQFYNKSITTEEKKFLDSVEAFDELEEFILFCQHYVILYASTSKTPSTLLNEDVEEFPTLKPAKESYTISSKSLNTTHKKFAAGCIYKNDSLLQNGGFTTKRTSNNVLITSDESQKYTFEKEPFKERMCHSITRLGADKYILSGGRLAPNAGLNDAWILEDNKWTKTFDLPEPRSRHDSFTSANGDVFIYGGNFKAESQWLKFDLQSGWTPLTQENAIPNLVGAAIAFNPATNSGFIFGGLKSDYFVNTRIYSFTINAGNVISNDITSKFDSAAVISLARYGAKALFTDEASVIVAGGVSEHSLILGSESLLKINLTDFSVEGNVADLIVPEGSSLPLLSGFNVDKIDSDLVVYGGGAICFSFGAYWNDLTVLSLNKNEKKSDKFIALAKAPVVLEKPVTIKADKAKSIMRGYKKVKVKPVPRVSLDSIKDFDAFMNDIYSKQTPVVIEKVNVGASLSKWKDPKYLINAVGSDRKIVAHVSDAPNLNFLAKNFEYKTLPFGEFIQNVYTPPKENAKNMYLRSLSSDKPQGKPAIFRHDFEALSADFVLPPPLAPLEDQHFSSPLRISSPKTAIWTHYDVTANILCQVVGSKKVRLYPPSDVSKLSFPAGASTSLIDNIFEFPDSALGGTKPLETTLAPGDIVFIPACWIHATLPLDVSISLNFFWKDLKPEVYGNGKKDIYGNKDIEDYENGRKTVAKLAQSFKGVPEEVRKFYLLRLVDELKESI